MFGCFSPHLCLDWISFLVALFPVRSENKSFETHQNAAAVNFTSSVGHSLEFRDVLQHTGGCLKAAALTANQRDGVRESWFNKGNASA